MARLRHLDVLRGFALLGILPVNLPHAAFPSPEVVAAATATPADRTLDFVVDVLFERRFITIFAFLFGVGLALQRRAHEERAAAGPVRPSWAEWMARRLGTLFLFGALHAVLLWHGDIVAQYAAVGAFGALLAVWRSARGLAWTGVLLSLTPVVFSLGLAALAALARTAGLDLDADEAASSPADPAAPFPRYLGETVRAVLGDDAAFETAVFAHGDFARAAALRFVLWAIHTPVVLGWYGLRLLGLFALGMAVVRSGWADDPGARGPRLRRVAVLGLGVGLPLAVAGWSLEDPEDPVRLLAAEAIRETASLLVAAAYASLVTLWAVRRDGSALRSALEAVGRTAFSNYVLQSVVMAAVFTGLGLGLHGRLGYAGVLAIAPPAWALAVVVSLLWTRRAGQGPVERAWRAVAGVGLPRRDEGPAPPAAPVAGPGPDPCSGR